MSDFNSDDFFAAIPSDTAPPAVESNFILTEGKHNLKILTCEQKETKNGHMLSMSIQSTSEGKRLYHNLIIDHPKTDVVARAKTALQAMCFVNKQIENPGGLVGFEFSANVFTEKSTGQYGDSSRMDDRTIAAKDNEIGEIGSSTGQTSSADTSDFF